MIKRFFVLFLISLFCNVSFAKDLIIDDSIHPQIMKDYNLSQEEDLPLLPDNIENEDTIFAPDNVITQPTPTYTQNQNTQTQTTTQKQTSQQVTTQKEQVKTSSVEQKIIKDFKPFTLHKGMKFKVVNSKAISDSMKKGTQLTFVSTIAETDRYVTIPKGTVFKGKIVDSHTPNMTGNGGLLVIKVDKIYYNGKYYPMNAKITMANQKKIFFNNIKGERRYWKNIGKANSWGVKTYKKMWAKTKKYFKPGIEIIVSPVAFLTGTCAVCINSIASPFMAVFSKGGKLTIPQYARFEIKLLEDVYIKK